MKEKTPLSVVEVADWLALVDVLDAPDDAKPAGEDVPAERGGTP